MYGYTAEEAIGSPIDIVILEEAERRQEELDIRAQIARGERVQHHETIRRRKDGTSFEVSLSLSPVRDATGRTLAAAGIMRDISERKRLEDDRRRASGLLERFADFTAHDFRAPMQHIHWHAEEAAELLAGSAPPRAQLLLDRIIAKSRWMQRRTDGLQAASGVSGGRNYERARVSAAYAFDDAHEMLASVDQFVQEAHVSRDDLPEVVSNEVLLGFLFQNLLQNACKYGRETVPVVVHVSARRTDEAWEFAIQDNGRGVPADRADSIFEPYVRGDNVAMDQPGTGIGLTFCRAIVEWHKGRIWVEAGPGSGSIFKFTIPARGAEA
jgi:PAS domain S-box-containing protein